jgi:hypothetical protein
MAAGPWPGLPAGDDYQVCFYPSNATGGSSDPQGYLSQCYDNPVTVALAETTAGIDATVAGAGAISGTVTDAAAPHGLADVYVQVISPSNWAYGYAYTAADGSYTAKGLAAGDDYEVCFHTSGATGGSSDAAGYAPSATTASRARARRPRWPWPWVRPRPASTRRWSGTGRSRAG